MTYRELLLFLQNCTDSQLDDSITVLDPSGEYYGIARAKITVEDDVLDSDHIYLVRG